MRIYICALAFALISGCGKEEPANFQATFVSGMETMATAKSEMEERLFMHQFRDFLSSSAEDADAYESWLGRIDDAERDLLQRDATFLTGTTDKRLHDAVLARQRASVAFYDALRSGKRHDPQAPWIARVETSRTELAKARLDAILVADTYR